MDGEADMNHRLSRLILFRVLLILALLLLLWTGCPFYRLFSIPCPGCGLTRAWLAFLRGDISAAFEFHRLFLFVPAFLLLYAFRQHVSAQYVRAVNCALFVFAAAMAVNYLLCLIK